ncbi:unnamed protein product [Urochloa decumbens]|uniref:Ubiquitin-like protease family profile domain-containing protein n=1 Tax=Urochloa decumbens TaxID=240449 RepID=A0ABC9B5W7_9POAL
MENPLEFTSGRVDRIVHHSSRLTRSATKQAGRSAASGGYCSVLGSSEQGDSQAHRPTRSIGDDPPIGGKLVKKIPKFHGSFSTDHVEEVISTFGDSKLSILERIGLGGLKHLKANLHHSRALVFWLQQKIDVAGICVRLDKKNSIEMTADSFGRILGVRSKGTNFEVGDKYKAPSLRRKLHYMFRTDDEKTLPTVADANKILLANYGEVMSSDEEEAFAVALAALVCAYMFGNMNRAAIIPNDIWGFISEWSNLLTCSWSGYILNRIVRSSARVQANMCAPQKEKKGPFSINLGGCWLYLELLYLDYIDFAERNIPWSWVPRVRVYEKSHIKEFISIAEIGKAPTVFLMNKRRLPCVRDGIQEDAAGMEQRATNADVRPMKDTLEELKESIDESFANMMDCLNKASDVAHKENLTHFESQRSHINRIFADLRVSLQNEKSRVHGLISRYGAGDGEPSNHTALHDDTVEDSPEPANTSSDMDVDGNDNSGFGVGASTSGINKESDVAVGKGGTVGPHMSAGDQDQQAVADERAEEVTIRMSSVLEDQVSMDGIHFAEQSVQDAGQEKCTQERVGDSISAAKSPLNVMRNDSVKANNAGVEYPLYDQTPPGGSAIKDDEGLHQFFGKNIISRLVSNEDVAYSKMGDLLGNTSTCEGVCVPAPSDVQTSGSVLDCPVFDATPPQHTTHIDNTPSDEVHGTKRKRVKKSAVKKNEGWQERGTVRKVCSSKKPYRPNVGQVNKSSNAIVLVDSSKVDETCVHAEKHMPCKRHVERRCCDSSPFELNMIHRETETELADKHYKLVMSDTDDHLSRDWIIISKPTRIRITGEVLQQEFKEGAAISSEVFAAMVWVLQCQENALYNMQDFSLNHWRHFMGPEFAEAVLGSNKFIITEGIRKQFIGWHLGSKFEHCRMVLVPSCALGHWCLYLWDIEHRIIHIMDPVNGKLHPDEQRKLHHSNVSKLHAAMHMCKQEMFTGWNDDFNNYNDVYMQYGYPVTKRGADSAFYVLHYMRWFDGKTIRYNCDRANVWTARKTMLHDLILVRGNTGYVPAYIAGTVNLDS